MIIVFIIFWWLNRKLLSSRWWLGQILLSVSPWFIQLWYAPLEFSWLMQPNFSLKAAVHNLSVYSSADYIFFSGERRLQYGNQETGLLHLTYLPLVSIGLIQVVATPTWRWLGWWLGGGFVLASLFAKAPFFFASLLYLVPAQLLVGIGVVKLINFFPRQPRLIKLLIFALSLLVIYEVVIFAHIIAIHYPKRLEGAGISL